MFIIHTFSTCFGHHYAHLQETKTCVTARGVLRWYCWMWLVAVVGRWVLAPYNPAPHNRYLHSAHTLQPSAPQPLPSQCSHPTTQRPTTATFTVLAPYNPAPHNRYQPHPAVPAQHTTCSNTSLRLLKMGIMMPETCWESVDNKHLTVASSWFSLSLHTATMTKVPSHCVCTAYNTI